MLGFRIAIRGEGGNIVLLGYVGLRRAGGNNVLALFWGQKNGGGIWYLVAFGGRVHRTSVVVENYSHLRIFSFKIRLKINGLSVLLPATFRIFPGNNHAKQMYTYEKVGIYFLFNKINGLQKHPYVGLVKNFLKISNVRNCMVVSYGRY